MITVQGLNEFAESIFSVIKGCRVTVGEEILELEPQKSRITSNSAEVYFLLDEGAQGEITGFELISNKDTVLAIKPMSIKKDGRGGLLIRFSLVITEG